MRSVAAVEPVVPVEPESSHGWTSSQLAVLGREPAAD
jgi:hypothetical protein